MKKVCCLFLLVVFVSVVWTACKSEGPRSTVFEQNEFKNPDNPFRAVPFYSLNDKLEGNEMIRQIGIMKKVGYGGAFLHSRIGLLTPYLQKEWFDMMDVGTKALQDNRMNVWYYDEDKWPSGYAGGIVPRANPKFQARCLLRMPLTYSVTSPDSVLWKDSRWQYICRVNPMGQARYNGTSWVDLMNPDVVKLFIESSYKPYVERYRGQARIMGMFTDEPSVIPRPEMEHQGAVSYSPVLDSVFRVRCGYELNPVIPSLFDTVGNWRKVRLDYYRTVAYCMEQAFSKPIGDYCAENGMIWTGHFNGEDTPALTMRNEGNLMQQLRHMQQPGFDALALRLNTIYSAKGMTSVANQYGRERRLVELFGISGQNMSFEDRIWITSWCSVMGVNFMCPHLYLYSMKGERKRDYPPAISHQQPYWDEEKLFEDYSARLCYFGTIGKTVADVCVIHPQESSYLDFQTDVITPVGVKEPLFEDLFKAHRNFDFGDEQIISEIGKIENNRFVIGQMAYKMLVVPELKTIRRSTIALLNDFSRKGGTVWVYGNYPTYVDGEVMDEVMDEFKTRSKLVSPEDFLPALEKQPEPSFTLSGKGAESVWTLLRKVDDKTYSMQLSNLSRTDTHQLRLKMNQEGKVVLWNPIDGSCLKLNPDDSGAYALQFAPAQTWIVTVGPQEKIVFDGEYRMPYQRSEELVLEGEWTGKKLAPNAITLDFAQFSKDGGKTWGKAEPVLAFYDRTAQSRPYNGALQLKYEIKVDELPKKAALVLEQPEMYHSVCVNGQKVDYTRSDFYVDHTFRTGDVTSFLKKGVNEIVLSLDYKSPILNSYNAYERYGTEIESVYLIGDFGVQSVREAEPLSDTWRNRGARLQRKAPVNRLGSFSLVKEKESFKGDLSLSGYPFYAGSFELSKSFRLDKKEKDLTYVLSFPDFEATLISVEVNGTAFQPLFTSPWETDITSALKEGENQIRLKLTNTLRNLLGPHHHKGGEFTEVRPVTFRASKDVSSTVNEPTGEENWYDARLGGHAILWRDYYHIIPFGLLNPPVIYSERSR